MNLCPSSFPARKRELLVITQSVQLLPAPRQSLSQTDGATASPHSHRAGHAADSYCEIPEAAKARNWPPSGVRGGTNDLELLPGSTFWTRHFGLHSVNFLTRKAERKIPIFQGYGNDEMGLDTQKT